MERRTTEPTAISTSRYRAELVKLMSFKDDKTYDASHSFTAEKLISITPTLVCHWMNKRAYGDPEPNEDIRPIHVRSSIAKKAVSAFMPRLNKTWDPVTKQGKPTRSDDVNKLIKCRVKSTSLCEFISVLELIRSSRSPTSSSLMIGSVLTLQWHIIARIDDMMKLQFSNFSYNSQYPFKWY
ncbi:hypothetical protein F442_15121, partial [Phytophthora nicotianae P10297]